MKRFDEFLPIPHWSRAYFKANNIPLSAVAKALHLSYTYTCNMLSGVATVTSENEAKLTRLAEGLEIPSLSAPAAEEGEEVKK